MAARTAVQIRMQDSGVKQLDSLADCYGVPRADVIRVCMAVAFYHISEVRQRLEQRSEEL